MGDGYYYIICLWQEQGGNDFMGDGGLSLLLLAPPGQGREAASFGLPVAHLAYRVGGGGHLFRSDLSPIPRGGFLAMDAAGCDGRGRSDTLAREILRECDARGFTGVLCDFEGPPLPLLTQTVAALDEALGRRGWPLLAPEPYANFLSKGQLLISSALSGGSLRQRLSEVIQTRGAEGLALAVEPVAYDFPLPSPDGQGRPLEPADLQALRQRWDPQIYFSDALCAHYFTYMSRESGGHFVLFDDAASVRKKLRVAAQLGIRRAVLPYPQAAGAMEAIMADRRRHNPNADRSRRTE